MFKVGDFVIWDAEASGKRIVGQVTSIETKYNGATVRWMDGFEAAHPFWVLRRASPLELLADCAE